MKAFVSGLLLVMLVGAAALFALAPARSISAEVAARASQADQGRGKSGSMQGAATATPTCPPSWVVVSSPNAVTGVQQYGYAMNQLTGVAVVAEDDVWAVGYYNDPNPSTPTAKSERVPRTPSNERVQTEAPTGSQGLLRTLVEHWDGTSWTLVPSPNNGTDDNVLMSVVAVAANDVWAAGYYINEFGVSQTLVLHWNGTAWSVVDSPNVGPLLDNRLTAIDAASTDDVWAVGYYYNDVAIAQTLTMHWDGTEWSVVDSPNVGERDNNLYAVTVVDEDDAWAVGSYTVFNGYQPVYKALALHWNGLVWSPVDTPSVGSFNNTLYGVDAVAANDVWAVGLYGGYSGNRSLIEHWDGTKWSPVVSPNTEVANDLLYDVDAISANDVWAVGQVGGYNSPPAPLTVHWDGTEWKEVPAPRVEQGEGFSGLTVLLAIDAAANQDVWAVGYFEGGPNFYERRTLTEHYSDECVSCSTSFSDVPPGSPFYEYVQCLACQGIVSGYPCEDPADPCNATPGPSGNRSYYRPNSPVTRGQLAKIISNSARMDDPPGEQMFEDVWPYSPFYYWVNQLARRGIIAGYPCGTVPNEPCGYNNLPYFRPNDYATRGQIAKIVSNAAGYSDEVPATQQSFADVPHNSPFWLYVERLKLNGSVISGYACGGAGEPCPGTYFRPQNNASRGQVAKIVSKAFLTNCYVP